VKNVCSREAEEEEEEEEDDEGTFPVCANRRKKPAKRGRHVKKVRN
jgi:hypothetical protein